MIGYIDPLDKMEQCGTSHAKGQMTFEEYLARKPQFDGAAYSQAFDHKRLTGQIRRVFDLMKDGRWRTLEEIAAATGDPQASVSAQLRHLRKPRFGGFTVEKRAKGEREHGLFEYRLSR
jgi:hypothetical protein